MQFNESLTVLYNILLSMSHSTPHRSFWRHSSQPIAWHSTEKTNLTQQKDKVSFSVLTLGCVAGKESSL